MKRCLFFATLFLFLGLSSCQCAEKPDVGPVEGEGERTSYHFLQEEKGLTSFLA